MCDGVDREFDKNCESNATTGIQILKSEADRTGHDIASMSDFMGDGIRILNHADSYKVCPVAGPLSATALSEIHDVLSIGTAIIRKDHAWVPDFDSLPGDIRKKLEKGIYKIGESRQVNGNRRAVIVDDKSVRVKDITLKQIKNEPYLDISYRNLLTHIKLQQISSLLEDIVEMQAYQIKCNRNVQITVPFLNARDLVFKAERESNHLRRQKLLEEASQGFGNVSNTLYGDLHAAIDLLAQRASRRLPLSEKRVCLFLNTSKIYEAMGFILDDLQMLHKSVGLQIQINNLLNDKASSECCLRQYGEEFKRFCEVPLDSTGRSASQIVHAHFPNTDENMNAWYRLKRDSVKIDDMQDAFTDKSAIYLVGVKDVEGEHNE